MEPMSNLRHKMENSAAVQGLAESKGASCDANRLKCVSSMLLSALNVGHA